MYRSHVLVCGGTGCTSSGSERIVSALEREIQDNGLSEEVKVIKTGCFGLCALGPIMIVYPEGAFYSMVKPEDIPEIVSEHLLKGRIVTRLLYQETVQEDTVKSLNHTQFYAKQKRVALKNCGVIDPENINEYIGLDGYMALGKVLTEMTPDQVIQTIKDSGLRTMYEQEKGEKGQTRIENLEELVTATRQFSYNEEDEDLMPLQAFLSHAALEAGEGQADTWQDAVQLMTLHSAKGLEFPQVFIVGMEEGMFPSQMSLDEGGRLEEERRLAYVGVTRAMQKLTLTYAETRRLYGKEVYHRPSRFIGELPEECVEEVRLRATVSRPVSHQRMGTPMVENDSGYKLGQRVRHAKFGEGTIVNMEGSGEHSRLQVAFQGQGIKWLVAAYARLETV